MLFCNYRYQQLDGTPSICGLELQQTTEELDLSSAAQGAYGGNADVIWCQTNCQQPCINVYPSNQFVDKL